MAILYGMSVKEFWEDDPDLFWAYRFSYLNKLKTEQEIFNNKAWLQGMYFYDAISASLNNAFSKTKVSYAKEPYSEKEEVTREEQQNALVTQLMARVKQVQAIKGEKEENSTPTNESR